jgi:hypothetical protein
MEVSLSVDGRTLIGVQLLSIRGITTALQLRLGGVTLIHIAIDKPNQHAGLRGLRGHLKI